MKGSITLPPGTYFKFRYRGRWDYGLVMPNQFHWQLLAEEQVPSGTTVHVCVWVGPQRNRLESRKTEVKQ